MQAHLVPGCCFHYPMKAPREGTQEERVPARPRLPPEGVARGATGAAAPPGAASDDAASGHRLLRKEPARADFISICSGWYTERAALI